MADVYPDWFFLPNPATLRFPFAVSNQTGSTVYVKTILTGLGGGALPSGWTDTPKQHGSLAHGSTLYAYHQASRSTPTFTGGVYDEQIELRIQFYSDALYTTLVLTLVEQLNVYNYNSSLADWTLHDSDDFEIDSEGWLYSTVSANTWGGPTAIPRYSGKGYASTYAIGYTFTGQDAGSLQVLLGDGNLSVGQPYTLETRMFLDTKGLNIPDVWHVFGGRYTLVGPNIGLAMKVTAEDYYAYNKKFAKPVGVTDVRVSGVVRYDSTDSRWYVDKVRWVKK